MMSESRISIRLGGMIWPERARGADRAARDLRVVAAPQQRRQRQQPERDHGGADDAGGGAHQHADADDAERHAAAQAARQMADHVEQVIGEARLLEHHAHEDEERDREPLVVGDDAVDARRQQVEQRLAEAEKAEDEAARGERDADRHAGHQQREEAEQQADREPLLRAHCDPRSDMARTRSAALTACAAACSANSAKPSGISAFSIQRCVSPPGSDEISSMPYDCCNVGDRVANHQHRDRDGQQRGDEIDDRLAARRIARVEHVDAHVLALAAARRSCRTARAAPAGATRAPATTPSRC